MLTSAPSRLTPTMLWALLLMPTFLSTQKGIWDNLTCTEGVVSVSRGERAVMACNISNLLSHVTICLIVPGKDCLPIFQNMAPGHFSQGGWQLWVRGCMAQLVTEKAQDTQAGRYRWLMDGRQKTYGTTTLNVSEPQEPPFTPSWGPGTLYALPEAQGQSQSQVHVTLALVLIVPALSILGLGLLVWYRRRPSSRLQQLPQMKLVLS